MSRNQTLRIMRAALLAAVLVAPGVWAQVSYDNLHTFTRGGLGGSQLTAGLVFDQAGNLYGTAESGGKDGMGTVFKLSPNGSGGWTETVLFNFTGAKTGSTPVSGLVFDGAGNLYGTTSGGGGKNGGTVYKLSPNSDGKWTETLLHNFAGGQDGIDPLTSLIFDQAGNLYGTTFRGGSSNCWDGCGTVFELSPTSGRAWTEKVIYRFCEVKGCADGSLPYGTVVFDTSGNLYSTTGDGGIVGCGDGSGCGTVYRLSPNSDGTWTQTVLHAFCADKGCPDGMYPLDTLILDQAGNIYGTAELGGKNQDGVVFELSPGSDATWTETILHEFKGTDGDAPYAGVIFDKSGNLYGTTFEGGSGGGGVAYELIPNSSGGWGEVTLHNFDDHPGAIIWSGLVIDSQGNLYGTTYGDSNGTFGSAYKITP
jgi:uncharacterized repeat protein (TIGR03803 family)